MISPVIWCNVNIGKFFKDYKLHLPYGLVQFCCLWKIYSWSFTSNCIRNHVISHTNCNANHYYD